MSASMEYIAIDEEFACTPPHASSLAKESTFNLLPDKSKTKYKIQYELFNNLCRNKKVSKVSQNLTLVYFAEK